MESEFSHIFLLGAFPDATDTYSETSIVYYSIKDACKINTIETLLNILFSEVNSNISASQHDCFPQLQMIWL